MILKGLAAAAASVVAAVLTAGPAPAATVPPLTCTASVSNTRPQDYTTEHVYVTTRGNRPAQVTTTAYYRTSRPVRYTTDPRPGVVSYWISDATPGYRVTVQVVVRSGRQSGYCTTAFTPQRRPVPPPPAGTVHTLTCDAGPVAGFDADYCELLGNAVAAEPSMVTYRVADAGLTGAVTLYWSLDCPGLSLRQGVVTGYTPFAFDLPELADNGQGCTVTDSEDVDGSNLGVVRSTLTVSP